MGVSRFSIGKFLSHSAEKSRRGILYCCIILRSEKVYEQEGGGEYQDFPTNFFCLTLPKISVRNPLLLQ